ncbi:uncharacterized protein EI90DRAFT_3097979, partial [Cantharellus anzutake]|uniref:uncharacterized protein n=1 Tax=Cantharellus anzutake TaxID=1750568 RepID=UPI001907C9C9
DAAHETMFENFDHLVVATGRYHFPHEGNFPGRETWLAHRNNLSNGSRDIRHSIWYEDATPYVNKTALVVGGGASAQDITRFVAEVASKVYQSISKKSIYPPGGDIIRKARLSHFTRDAVHFEDGSFETDIDSVILATGYELRVPFLEVGGSLIYDPTVTSRNTTHIHPPPHLPLTSNGPYVRPLYRHTMSLSSQFPPTALFVLSFARHPPPQATAVAQSIFATRLIANPALVDPHRIKLLRELEEYEERLRNIGLNPDVSGHRLVDWNHDYQESSNFQESLINFLMERNVTRLPLRGSNHTYVEDWRRRMDTNPSLVVTNKNWLELEARGETEALLRGREKEEDWIELLDCLRALDGTKQPTCQASTPLQPAYISSGHNSCAVERR